MGFFDDLGSKLNDVADRAAEKVNEISEMNLLHSELAGKEQKLQGLYIDLGKRVYSLAADDPASVFAEQCRAVAESEARAATLKQQFEPKPEPAPQPVCTEQNLCVPAPAENTGGPAVSVTSAVAENAAESAGEKFCTNCGARNPGGTKFCSSCGSPLSF